MEFFHDSLVKFMPGLLCCIGAQVQPSELLACAGSICIMRTPVPSELNGVDLSCLTAVFKTRQVIRVEVGDSLT